MNEFIQLVSDEVIEGLNSIDTFQFEKMALEIAGTDNKIIGVAAGRMGYSLKGFIMRLSHLGYSAYMLGDTNLPRVNTGDLVIISTSSGETPSIKLFAEQAKNHGAQVCVVTASPDSTIGSLADVLLCYKNINSKQLMKTYHEQLTWLLYDAMSMLIFKAADKNKVFVENNHSILE